MRVRRGKGLGGMKNDLSLPLWKETGYKGMVGKDRSHSSGGTVFGGAINLKIRSPLTHESCLSLPSV